ncbi:MAG TPA: DUF2178 domain-containing protein [Methanoregulaceae archaeon]|nr:DUF2178 domain-containing protein [Methanoregulaceae archaeon]
MQKNTAMIAGIAIVIAMIAGIVYGVRAGNPVIPVIAFLAGAGLLFLMKRNVTGVIEDEWTRLVEQKAANLTMNATSFLFTVIALFLITVSNPDQNYDQAVYAIAAVLVSLTIGQVLTTMYYSRTLRGTGP